MEKATEFANFLTEGPCNQVNEKQIKDLSLMIAYLVDPLYVKRYFKAWGDNWLTGPILLIGIELDKVLLSFTFSRFRKVVSDKIVNTLYKLFVGSGEFNRILRLEYSERTYEVQVIVQKEILERN